MTVLPYRHALLLLATLPVACGGGPSEPERPDVDPQTARQPVTDVPPDTPREVPPGADAAGVVDPPEEGEDATPVLNEARDQDGVTDPAPER